MIEKEISFIPEQSTVKAYPALFEGEGDDPKMRHCYSSLQLTYTFKTHTKHYSSLQLTYTFKTRTKHTKTAKACTLCVYQRLSITIQRGNAACIQCCFIDCCFDVDTCIILVNICDADKL